MHESALARQVLDAVLAAAEAEGAKRVSAVRGWVAETEALRPDAIEFHFRAHARGTPAEHATLHLELRHVQARCSACGEVYAPEHHLTLCPKCASTDAELLGDTGIGIDAIDVD